MLIRISGHYTQLLAIWLEQNGLESTSIHYRLEECFKKDSVTVETWRELLNEAALISPHRHFGLEVGVNVTLKHVGVLGFLVASCESLAEALEVYQLCERRFYSVNFALLRKTQNFCELVWNDQLGEDNALFVQVALSSLVSFLRLRFPTTFELQSVTLTEKAPIDSSPYSTFFGCPVIFGSNQPGIRVCNKTANRKENAKLPNVFKAIQEEHKEAFSSTIGFDDPLMIELQRALLKGLGRGNVSLTSISKDLCTSPRTLQRRLSEYDLSYQSLLDGVREKLACQYLQQDNLTYVEMSYLLGFSEQSAFNRAFKKWTGTKPSHFQVRTSSNGILEK